jgi:hypothetical protein
MLLQFINEAKEEIEESGWPWQALRQTVTVTLASSTVEYTLTSAGDADVDTNDRTRLLYETVNEGGSTENFRIGSGSKPQVFDVTDSNEVRLKEWTQEKMERVHFTDDDITGDPTHFSLYTDGTSLKMKVYPIPDAARTLKMRLFIPQDELTSTDITTSLLIPDRACWMRALFKANQERGEELGKPDSTLDLAQQDALGSAAGYEMTPADMTVSLER